MSDLESVATNDLADFETLNVVSTSTSPTLVRVNQKAPSNQRPRLSTWAYIKWFIWSTISGLFGCRAPIFATPFDDIWPTTSSLTDKSTSNPSTCSPCLQENSSPQLDFANGSDQSYSIPDSKNQNYSTDICTSVLTSDTSIESSELSQNNNPLHLTNGYCSKLNNNLQNQKFTNLLCSNNHAGSVFVNTFNSSTELICPSTFTLLNLYKVASLDGLVDSVTRDHIVQELLDSVMPRNLSNSSEVDIPAGVRQMYAWDNHPNNQLNEKISPKFDLEMSSSTSDDPVAYPGGSGMSDHSYSLLSPSTLDESTPPTDDFYSSAAPKYDDLDLPNVNRSDQTLAWAISNLHVESNVESDNKQMIDTDLSTTNNVSTQNENLVCDASEKLKSCETIADKPNMVERSAISNSFNRQSRDRSPVVTTVTSNRFKDAYELSTFLPFEGNQLFTENDKDCYISEPPKPKRSSSLKSSRTPPGTPVQKAVRFADALGLDLATVRHVFDSEAPPKIPASATFDLELDSDECIAKIGAKQFGLCFPQPGVAPNFIRRVLSSNVCLEDARIDMPRGLLTGTIRVKSLGFEKHVYLRITYNNWITYFDTPASYVQGSHDGVTDRFSFSLVFPETVVPGDKAQFAVRYEAHNGEQFWDNNHGQNYAVTCYAKATDLAGDGSWLHYL